MGVVLVMFKDGERRDFPLEAGETTIGRRQDCRLRVQTADVSRQHCVLTVAGGGVAVRDLDSANGTFVNNARVTEAKLKAGDKLKVGPAVFVVQINGEPREIKASDTQVDLVELEASEGPTHVSGGAASRDGSTGSHGALTEDDLFEISDDELDLDDPIAAMEAILDEEDDDEEERPPKGKKKG